MAMKDDTSDVSDDEPVANDDGTYNSELTVMFDVSI